MTYFNIYLYTDANSVVHCVSSLDNALLKPLITRVSPNTPGIGAQFQSWKKFNNPNGNGTVQFWNDANPNTMLDENDLCLYVNEYSEGMVVKGGTIGTPNCNWFIDYFDSDHPERCRIRPNQGSSLVWQWVDNKIKLIDIGKAPTANNTIWQVEFTGEYPDPPGVAA